MATRLQDEVARILEADAPHAVEGEVDEAGIRAGGDDEVVVDVAPAAPDDEVDAGKGVLVGRRGVARDVRDSPLRIGHGLRRDEDGLGSVGGQAAGTSRPRG